MAQVQLLKSSRQSPCCVPPAQEEIFPEEPPEHEAHQDELDRATIPSPSNDIASHVPGPRCINGELVGPTPPSDDSPSTACQASTVYASEGVRLGKANPPCFGAPQGVAPVPSRRIPPPPPPAGSRQSSSSAANPVTYPRQWTPLHTQPKTSGGGPPDGSGGGGGGSGSGTGDPKNPSI